MNQEKMVTSFDGTKLFMRIDSPKQPKAVVVIVHGLAEHLNRYDELTTRLVNDDYVVYRYDQRGHARSEGKRVFFNDFNELPDDCKAIVDMAKVAHQTLGVYLIGHSMGGFAVTLFGTKYPGAVKGIVTSGALTRYNHQAFGPLPIDAPKDSYLDNQLGQGVCSDPTVGITYNNDPLVERKISVGLINMLPAGVSWLIANSMDFVEPTLILHGADDGIVSEKDSRDFFGDIGSTDKTLKIYGKLYHEIFNEPVKQQIYTEVIYWLNQQLDNKKNGGI